MSAIRILGLPYSVYTRTALLVCEEKGVEYELQVVDVFDVEADLSWYRRYHPFCRIPTLVDDDFCLYETTAISRYIDERFGGPSLQPSSARDRARVNQIISILDSYAYRAWVWDIFVERVDNPREGRGSDEARIHAALPVAERCLAEISRIQSDNGFLVGDVLSVADLHAWPMLNLFAMTTEGKQRLAGTRLGEWLQRMQQRASIALTKSDYG